MIKFKQQSINWQKVIPILLSKGIMRCQQQPHPDALMITSHLETHGRMSHVIVSKSIKKHGLQSVDGLLFKNWAIRKCCDEIWTHFYGADEEIFGKWTHHEGMREDLESSREENWSCATHTDVSLPGLISWQDSILMLLMHSNDDH